MPSKDVLELGCHLVNELGFADGVDTLGRWMSHHLAELMDRAENAKTSKQKKEASREAAELILKLWEHRTSLPGNAYPIARFTEILQVLDTLRPEANPWEHNRLPGSPKLAAEVYEHLCNITRGLLFADLATMEKKNGRIIPKKALTEDETKIYEILTKWAEKQVQMNSLLKPDLKDQQQGLNHISVSEVVIPIIDRLIEKLNEIKLQLMSQNSKNKD